MVYFCVIHLILIEVLVLDIFYTGKLNYLLVILILKNHLTHWIV